MKNKNIIIGLLILPKLLLLPNTIQAQGINISSTGSIAFTGAASIEIKNGGFVNNGVFTFSTGSTVTFNSLTNQTISGSAITSFYNLIINNAAGVTLLQSVEVSHTLSLTNGIFDLNSNALTIFDNSSNAIIRTGGFVLSEKTDNSSKLKWNIGSTLSTYTFPFGTASGTYIPFILNHTAGNIGYVSVSTFPTAMNNTPLPSSPNLVGNVALNGVDNSANVVDRFWQIDKDGPAGTATLTFTTTAAETGSITGLLAQRWNTSSNKWDSPLPGQTNTGNSATVSNVTNFSPWTMSGNSSPLPISLVSFTAVNHNNYAKLNWVTESETNNIGFDIEKSCNLDQWLKVGFIAGAGNSSQVMNYFYEDLLTDEMAKEIEVVYYRLKQTDFNGVNTYSSTRSITLCLINQEKQITFNLFPNPVSEYININSNTSTNQFQGELYDHNGVQIKKFMVDGSIQLDISDCRPGGYIIVITDTVNGKKYRYTIIKSN